MYLDNLGLTEPFLSILFPQGYPNFWHGRLYRSPDDSQSVFTTLLHKVNTALMRISSDAASHGELERSRMLTLLHVYRVVMGR